MKKKLFACLALASIFSFGCFATACLPIPNNPPSQGDSNNGGGSDDNNNGGGSTGGSDDNNNGGGSTGGSDDNNSGGGSTGGSDDSNNGGGSTGGSDDNNNGGGSTGGSGDNNGGGSTGGDQTPDQTPDETPDDNKDEVTGDLVLTYNYAGNECVAFEWTENNISSAKVEYRIEGTDKYTTLDSSLIRSAATSGCARADILGLKGGERYEIVITSSSQKTATVVTTVNSFDRSGYAHFKYEGVGAYNDDGTPKSNAQIIYVSEATKNTVKATVGSKSCEGIVSILNNLSKSKVPVIIRFLDTIGAATWNKIDYNADKKYNGANLMPASVVKGLNGKQLPTLDKIWQADLIKGGYNTLNTSVWSELNGLDSRAKYSDGEYDTIWNNCSISEASNVTLEGVGENAGLFQWGLTWSKCNSIEVRNLTFEDYTEDACSFEGGSESNTISGFKSKHIWLHHNTFEEGINYWDLTAEQDKHEGDGATDFKRLAYLTTSYNVHHNNHKTGLVGGGDAQTTACVTFHHNYYNNNSSRLPLGRQANMHMYNNYYYKSTGTNMSIRAGAYAFIENCYFDNCNNPIEIKTGDSKTGAVKLYNNVFSGKKYTSNNYIYEVTDRTKVVANDNRYNQKFDTDANEFYYDTKNKCSDVTVMYTAEETKVKVPLLAGVQKRNGQTAIDPDAGSSGGSGSNSGSTGGNQTPETPTTIPTYNELLAKATYAEDFSSTADGTKLAELKNYDTVGLYSIADSTQGYDKSYTEVRDGKTNQVTNVGVSDVATNGKNTYTVIAFGAYDSVLEGYFEITTDAIGGKWDLIKFTTEDGNSLAVRIGDDKKNPLVYNLNGTGDITPDKTFVWKENTTYGVYFKISNGTVTVNVSNGDSVYTLESIAVSGKVRGVQFVSGNKGQRHTSIDNVVICAS